MLAVKKVKKEQRGAKRNKVLLTAFVSATPSAFALIPCILKDLSSTGCQIVGTSTDQFETMFYLRMTEESTPQQCRIVWRRKHVVGAEFVVAIDDAAWRVERTLKLGAADERAAGVLAQTSPAAATGSGGFAGVARRKTSAPTPGLGGRPAESRNTSDNDG
jgi:PilZ domain